MKHFAAIFLSLVMILGTSTAAFAAETDESVPSEPSVEEYSEDTSFHEAESVSADAPTEAAAEQTTVPASEAVTEAVTEAAEPLLGDANGNGIIDINDATDIQRHLAEMDELAGVTVNLKAADVNRDGKVDVQDVTMIQRYTAEFIKSFDEPVPAPPKELTLNETALLLGTGEQFTLTTSYTAEDGSVSFQTDNPDVATADETGLVTATGVGTATITAVTDRGVTAQCTVTVGKAISSVTLNFNERILGVGEPFQLTATVADDEVSHSRGFISDNPEVASVDENGTVTAKVSGTATISYQAYNGVSAACAVTVKDAPTSVSLNKTSYLLQPGEVRRLVPSVPDGQALGTPVFRVY